MLQHAVLMDAGLMGKGIGADDGLVGLHRKAGDRGDEPRRLGDELGLHAGVVGHAVVARAQRHDDLLERGIAGPLAEAVDGAFDLARTGADGGQRIGDGKAEIVVAVNGDDRLVDVRHAVHQHGDQRGEFLGHRIADGVRNIDRAGAALDRRLDAAAKEVMLAAGTILGRPLDIVAELARIADAVGDRLMHLLRLHLQLELHMQRAGGDEGMDARAGGALQRFPGAIDVAARRARQAGDGRCFRLAGDLAHRLEVAVGGDGEAGLDDVDAHLLEHRGDAALLVQVHRRARRLLAIAQRGVEDENPVLIHRLGHGFSAQNSLGKTRRPGPEIPESPMPDFQGRMSRRTVSPGIRGAADPEPEQQTRRSVLTP